MTRSTVTNFAAGEGAPDQCTLPGVFLGLGCRGCPYAHDCLVAEPGVIDAGHASGPLRDSASEASGRSWARHRAPQRELLANFASQHAGEFSSGPRTIVRDDGAPNTRHQAAAGVSSEPYPTRTRQGPQDTAIAIDRSGSMTDSDIKPSRLEAAKQAAHEYINTRAALSHADRVAVIAFGSGGRRMCDWLPLPGGIEMLSEAIRRIDADGCTSIGGGLREAEALHLGQTRGLFGRLFKRDASVALTRSLRHQRVILLSDGCHNTSPDPLPIAERLKKNGVLIDCIGIGSRSDVDEELLRRIASNENGTPRYRFIKKKDELLDHYRRLGGALTL